MCEDDDASSYNASYEKVHLTGNLSYIIYRYLLYTHKQSLRPLSGWYVCCIYQLETWISNSWFNLLFASIQSLVCSCSVPHISFSLLRTRTISNTHTQFLESNFVLVQNTVIVLIGYQTIRQIKFALQYCQTIARCIQLFQIN